MYVHIKSLHDVSRRDGSQRIDIVQHVGSNQKFVDKNIDLVHDRALSTLALQELDVWLTLESSPEQKSHLGSQHLVRLHHHYLADQRLHLIQEFCAQGDLLSVLKHEARRRNAGILTSGGMAASEADIQRTMRQILLGMDYIHQHNVAHMDISLENLLVTHQHQVKIGDFGLAIRCRRDATGAVTKQCVAYTGKRPYAAPELYYAGKPLDATKVDMWAIGMTMYMISTGTLLVQEATYQDAAFRTLHQHGANVVLARSARLARFSRSMKEFLSHLLQLDASIRFSTEQALAHEWLQAKGTMSQQEVVDLDLTRVAIGR